MYQGMEPVNVPTLTSTRLTRSENSIGAFVTEAIMAREIVSYLSVAMELTFLQPLPRIGTRELLVALLRTFVPSPPSAWPPVRRERRQLSAVGRRHRSPTASRAANAANAAANV